MTALVPDPAELAGAWRRRVEANNAQVARLREEPEGTDYYAPMASAFRADPRRADDPTLNALRALAQPDDVWMDVGAGAGRYALGLTSVVREVVAVEPSGGMRQELEGVRAEHGIENVRVLSDRWPVSDPATADVVSITHVSYDIAEIAAFLDTMERAARRLCVAVLFDRAPGSLFSELWPAVHGEAEADLPGLREFLVLLLARGILPEVRSLPAQPWRFDSLDHARAAARRRLWVAEGSPKAARLDEALPTALAPDDGGWTLRRPMALGLVTWAPSARGDSPTRLG